MKVYRLKNVEINTTTELKKVEWIFEYKNGELCDQYFSCTDVDDINTIKGELLQFLML
jgi:hypothetical protein